MSTPATTIPRGTGTSTCQHAGTRKLRYESERLAQIAAWQVLARSGVWLRAYRCGCGAWHLTHWEQR